MFINEQMLRQRINMLYNKEHSSNRKTNFSICENFIGRKKESVGYNEIYSTIQHWDGFYGGIDSCISECMNLIDEYYENMSECEIRNCLYFIENEVIPKTRDAKLTNTLIKRRVNRVRTKISTKINNNIEDMHKVVNNSLNNISNNLKSNISNVKSNIVKEFYEKMCDITECYIDCDRIIKNYINLSKRYNIDKIISYNGSDYKDSVHEICKLVETYNYADKIKFIVSIESSLFGLSKEKIDYNKKDIVDEAMSFFLNKTIENISNQQRNPFPIERNIKLNSGRIIKNISAFKSLSELKNSDITIEELICLTTKNCQFFKKYFWNLMVKEKINNDIIDYFKNKKTGIVVMSDSGTGYFYCVDDKRMYKIIADNIKSLSLDNYVEIQDYISESNKFNLLKTELIEAIQENKLFSLPDYYYWQDKIMKENKKEYIKENFYEVSDLNDLVNEAFTKEDLKDMIANFSLNDNKNLADAKNIIKKFYVKDAKNIIEGTPNILSWIRKVFVFGSCGIHPGIGLLTIAVDSIISLTLSRSETSKLLSQFKTERNKMKKKKEESKDSFEKDLCNQYLLALNQGVEKIEEYYSSLLTDKENDERDIDSSTYDDFDISLENSGLNNIEQLAELCEKVSCINEDDFLQQFKDCSINLDYDFYDNIVELYNNSDTVFSKDKLLEILNQIKQKCIDDNTISNYIKADVISQNIYTLEKNKDGNCKKINEFIDCYKTIVENNQALNEVFEAYKYKGTIMEASFATKLNMAKIKLQKNIKKLSDKEKTASRNIDSTVNLMQKNMERAVTNDNREAIIRGSIIPSASKIIKIALATGCTYLFNPVMAVIGALGYFATSAKLKAKERQLILDEIEIELKMVERYLRIAEEKNDMKSTKQLLTTQRTLERQRQRIKYKMKVEFNQDVPDVKDND